MLMFQFLKVVLFLANSEDFDEMQLYAAIIWVLPVFQSTHLVVSSIYIELRWTDSLNKSLVRPMSFIS